MLTGRAAPLSKLMKKQYKDLGLSHLFTPSGFHLSAVLLPVMKIFRPLKIQIGILTFIGLLLLFISGQGALKRMVLIKICQRVSEQKIGFISALFLDILVGTFSSAPLSFCYSFLFLGIIYSGKKNLFLWFFTAQLLIAYFQQELISPAILFLSPLLNFAFGISMPFLFLLAIPLWSWQLFLGLKILQLLQYLVETSAYLTTLLPVWEVNFGVLLACILFFLAKRKGLICVLCLLSWELNLDLQKAPNLGTKEFVPQGRIIKIKSDEKRDIVYWSDGRCTRELVRGTWWEKCSPKRRSTYEKFRKLSYL